MDSTAAFAIVILLTALVFDFANGWHDAANSIATVVSTRVLRPGVAVVWAAAFNFLAFVVFGTGVARTVGQGLVDVTRVAADWRLWVLLAALLGAIVWDVITWYFGLPSSSSHALAGGFAGGAIVAQLVTGGPYAGLLQAAGWAKILIFIVLSPLLGMALGFAFMVALLWIFRRARPDRVDHIFRKGQLLSAAAYSLGHGGNDAQNSMGIMTAVLVAGGFLASGPGGKLPDIPLWVVLSAHAAIALGTMTGGWRIVHTMGARLTRLKPVHGFAAETAGALTLALNTSLGIPVSTTHTITGAIVGVGATRRLSAVRWGVARRVVWAWIFTIPMSGLVAAAFILVVRLFKG
ncbi:MAG: inorganic phosphate transporter [Actinomycetota bacterium]